MQLIRLAALVVAITILGSGCLMIGKNKEYQPINSDELEKIVPGKTTAARVLEIVGAPSQIVKMSNGNAYIYKRSLAKATALWLLVVSFGNYEKQYDQLVFFFDNNDILTHYGVSQNANKASYGLPF